MQVLGLRKLKPGKKVWLEDNGFAFKELHISRATILVVTKRHIYFFPFKRLPVAVYNMDLTWRCWGEKPDLDSLCEMEWDAA